MADDIYRVPKELVERWRQKFGEDDKQLFEAHVTEETVYRVPKELVERWRQKSQEADIDVEQVLQDAELEERQARIDKLTNAGATWDGNSRTYSAGGRSYDEDGNPL